MTTTVTHSTRDLINLLVDGKTVQALNPERIMTVRYSITKGTIVYEQTRVELASFKQIIHAIKFVECLMYGGCEWKVLS